MTIDRDVAEEPSAKAKFSCSIFRYGSCLDYFLIAFSIVFNLASGVVMPIFMSLFGDMMDSIGSMDTAKVRRPLTFYVKAQLICGAISFVLASIGAATMELAAVRQTKTLKNSFLRSVMRQEIGWFDESDPGKLASTLQQNCVTVSEGIGLRFAQIFMFIGMHFGGYGVAVYRGWKLTMVVSASLPAIALTAGFMFTTISKADENARRAYAGAGSVVEETMLAIRPVVAYGLEQRMIDLFTARLATSFKSGLRTAIAAGSGLGITMGTLFLTYALGFWYGGKLIYDDLSHHGVMCFLQSDLHCQTGGTVMSVFFCVLIAAFALGQAGPNVSALGKAGAALEALAKVVDRESAIDAYSEEGHRVQKGELKGEIVFDRVSFAYPTRREQVVYRHLSFSVPPGQTVALVGASGCGKSTAISLLERFYDVDSGSVLIDKRDVRSYHLKSLRQRIGLVSQEPRLFASTIMENIRAGRLDATDEEVKAAAQQANAHTFICEFPAQYNTFVGEGGGQLSGGQKQRVAIARAILRDPEILILDEATSALDNESERIVQQTLDEIVQAKRRTTIIIAHRLSTIRRADKIIVLDNDGSGSVVAEEGSHRELIERGGLYAALVEAQQMGLVDTDANTQVLELAAAYQKEIPKSKASLIRLRSKFSRALSQTGASEGKTADRLQKSGGFGRVIQSFKPYTLQVFLGVLGAIMNGMVFPCFAICFGGVVNALYILDAEEMKHEVNGWCLVFVAFAVGVAFANALQHTFFGWAGYKALEILRRQLFEAIVYQDLSFFDDPAHTSGSLSEMLSADVVLLKGWVGDNLGIYLQNVVALVAALVVAFTASAKLAGVAVGAFLLIIPAVMIQSQLMQSGTQSLSVKDNAEANGETTGFILQESIMNIRTVVAYTLEETMTERYGRIVMRDYRRGIMRSYLSGLAWGFSQFVQFAVQALCLWYGGRLVQAGEIQTNKMMRTIFALIMAAMGMGQTMIFATNNAEAAAASHRIYGIIDRKPKIDARSSEGAALDGLKSEIKFEDVNFRYPQRKEIPIYSQINFSIKRGEVVALVGASGCGKSTAVQLIERFYEIGDDLMVDVGDRTTACGSGRLLFDGMNIKDINVKSLRSRIGLVSQEPVLFSTSIFENIACGAITDEVHPHHVEDAARKANALNFISQFPNQFETNVGNLGNQLSGGQKQRIAIARALIRDPEILILDEATSALDAESERVVQEALDALLTERIRTTLVIAHRLSTIRSADKIVVLLNKGQGSYVAEVGKHDELLSRPEGVYRHLVKLAEGR